MNKGNDRGSYYHEYFLRGMPFLCKLMKRLGSAKKLLTGSKAPLLADISAERPLPQGIPHDSLAAVMLSAINKSIVEGGPKAKMPVVHEAMKDFSFSSSMIMGVLTCQKNDLNNDNDKKLPAIQAPQKQSMTNHVAPHDQNMANNHVTNTSLNEAKPAAQVADVKAVLPQNCNSSWGLLQQHLSQHSAHASANVAATSSGSQIPYHHLLSLSRFDATALAAQSAPGVTSAHSFQQGMSQGNQQKNLGSKRNAEQLFHQLQSFFPQQPMQQHLKQQLSQPNQLSSVSDVINQIMSCHRMNIASNNVPPALALPQILLPSNTNASRRLDTSSALMAQLNYQMMQSQQRQQQPQGQDIYNTLLGLLAKQSQNGQGLDYSPSSSGLPFPPTPARGMFNHNNGLPQLDSYFSDPQVKELLVKAFSVGAKISAENRLQGQHTNQHNGS